MYYFYCFTLYATELFMLQFNEPIYRCNTVGMSRNIATGREYNT